MIGALMVSTALLEVNVERIWVVPPLPKVRESPPVAPMVYEPAEVSNEMLLIDWFAMALATVMEVPAPVLKSAVSPEAGTADGFQLLAVPQSAPLAPCQESVAASAELTMSRVAPKAIPTRPAREYLVAHEPNDFIDFK